MMKVRLLDNEEWRRTHREPLQKFLAYRNVLEHNVQGIETATRTLQDPEKVRSAPKSRLMLAARLRSEASLEPIIYGYSAGVPVAELSSLLQESLDHWESYAKLHVEFHESEESDGHLVPHIDLFDKDYWEALQLVCFSILFGRTDLLARVMKLLEYENDQPDALLEDLVRPFLPGRKKSEVYTRQLPYRKTKKIVAAAPDKRPALMSKYLDEWYAASRREPYFERHKSDYFPGYWSLEAAAITAVLGIDDASYRDKRFYPRDLVDFWRDRVGAPGSTRTVALESDAVGLRCAAGERCPRSGLWYTPASSGRVHFQQGDVMPSLGSDYGTTIWQWDDNQP